MAEGLKETGDRERDRANAAIETPTQVSASAMLFARTPGDQDFSEAEFLNKMLSDYRVIYRGLFGPIIDRAVFDRAEIRIIGSTEPVLGLLINDIGLEGSAFETIITQMIGIWGAISNSGCPIDVIRDSQSLHSISSPRKNRQIFSDLPDFSAEKRHFIADHIFTLSQDLRDIIGSGNIAQSIIGLEGLIKSHVDSTFKAFATFMAEQLPATGRELFVRRVLEAAADAGADIQAILPTADRDRPTALPEHSRDEGSGSAPARPNVSPARNVPPIAPELYSDRQNRLENPEQFILRVYGDPKETRMVQADLRRLDSGLYQAFSTWKMSNTPTLELKAQPRPPRGLSPEARLEMRLQNERDRMARRKTHRATLE